MDSSKAPDSDNLFCERIKEPNENDVLFGRGTRISNCQGNIRFRKIVQDLLRDYTGADKRGMKTELAKSVVAAIKDRQGRFLRKVTKTSSGSNSQESDCYWLEVEDMDLIMDKIKQTFRDTASTARQVQGHSNNYPSKSKTSPSLRVKSVLQKSQQRNAPKEIPSKGISQDNKTMFCRIDRTSTSTSVGNQSEQLVRDKGTISMGRASLQSDSATASGTRLAVNSLQRDFEHLGSRCSTLSGNVLIVVHQLEEARARVNQERQRLLRHQIEIQSALNVARLRQALVIPSLESQIMHGFNFGQIGLQRNPNIVVARAQINNPSFLNQARAFSNQTTHVRPKFLGPEV